MKIENLSVKVFADGADLKTIERMAADPLIKGFTTNPTLMRKAGVTDYASWAKEALRIVPNLPFSFEVLSDTFSEMLRQAELISSWGKNVYVKIPAVNTKGESTIDVVWDLINHGIKVNVTALMSSDQALPFIREFAKTRTPGYISIFAGRIADTGRDPIQHIRETVFYIRNIASQLELIWASPRQLLDLLNADQQGCHIITVTDDILKKIPLIGKDLDVYSKETAQMFFDDAKKAGYSL